MYVCVCVYMLYVFTYTINRSQSEQMFWPGGKPPVEGGAGRSIGALTCFVTGVVPNLCESVSTKRCLCIQIRKLTNSA